MSDYGVTEKGFVLKRMDTILEEVHSELTEGFGFDTRLSESSFLNVLVTTFCGQIADLWEAAQDEYYAKYPSTATGINLDNAVQFGGVRRKARAQNMYPLHCTGKDGTVIPAKTVVSTITNPEVRLYAAEEFTIERYSCNSLEVIVAAAQANATYTISINGNDYSFISEDANEINILKGLKDAITDDGYTVTVDERLNLMHIEDSNTSRYNSVSLTDNLTTNTVTSIAKFYTEEYGKITLPNGIVTKIIDNIYGFGSVTNILSPIYGRLQESDIELRQSYIARSAIRSNTMIDSIVSELLSNVIGVESAVGYENDTDKTNENGMPPHSIEIVVEGGDSDSIADAILQRKAGGIQTHGSISVDVITSYGDTIPIKFSRPEYLYTWIKVVLHGGTDKIPSNYKSLTTNSIVEYTANMIAGDSLLIQQLTEGIYDEVSGVTYVDIYTASCTDTSAVPTADDYKQENISATMRQKILIDSSRIEVSLYGDA